MSSPPRHPMKIGSPTWIATLGAMTAVVAMSIDMSLPAQPTFVATFGVAKETAALTLTLFLVGFAVAQLAAGYIADAIGRRKVLIGGLAIYVLGGTACALAPTIEVLLACRVLQAIGASTPAVVARAMVRDTQPAADAARLLSTMVAILAIAPMLAPTIGTFMLAQVGWRGIFVSLACIGTVLLVIAQLRLEETLPSGERVAPTVMGLVRGYREFFATPGTVLPLAIGCATFAGQFAYIADSVFVITEGYGKSTQAYSIYFGVTALALMAGSVTGGKILKRGRAPSAMIVFGTALVVIAGILVLIGTHTELGILGFFPPMLLYFFGVGMSGPSATAMALEPVPHLAGTGSAAMGFLSMIAGATAGFVTTKLGGPDPRVFAWIAAVMGTLAFVLAWAAAVSRRRRVDAALAAARR
jgi:DHA1 family bicyclomycin/chloramphenicol resistance-like MFS transporter